MYPRLNGIIIRKDMKKLIVILILFIPVFLSAKEIQTAAPLPIQQPQTVIPLISGQPCDRKIAENDLAINSILPGWWQLQQGETLEGVLCMSFWPLFVAANCFMFDYLLPVYLDSEAANINTGGQNYLYYSDSITSDQDRWKFYTAVVSSSVASLLYSWSVYDAESDFCLRIQSDLHCEIRRSPRP